MDSVLQNNRHLHLNNLAFLHVLENENFHLENELLENKWQIPFLFKRLAHFITHCHLHSKVWGQSI